MNNTFICQIIPKELIHKYNVSQAANNFCYNLIESYCFDKVISMIPLNVEESLMSSSSENIKFVQHRFLPQKCFRFINTITENLLTAISVKTKNVWFYNLTKYNLLSFLLLRFILNKKVFIILADYTPASKYFSVQNAIKYFIEKSHGIISLSSRSEFNHANQKVIPGIIPLNQHISTSFQNADKSFLFSGVLGRVQGIDMAIEVFSELPDIQLYISGREVPELVHIQDKYPNIHYIGFLPKHDYNAFLERVSFCLSFRNPMFRENINNFPSKILEYFTYNKVVVSTMEYPEIENFNYICVPYNKELLKAKIKELTSLPSEELIIFQSNNVHLGNTVSESAWKEAIKQLERNVKKN